jgi:hypothetical protein
MMNAKIRRPAIPRCLRQSHRLQRARQTMISECGVRRAELPPATNHCHCQPS